MVPVVRLSSRLGLIQCSRRVQLRARRALQLASPLQSLLPMRSVALVALAACSSPTPPVVTPASPTVVPRRDVPLPGPANGLYWDAGDHALYLTDSARNELIAWSDDKGFADVAALTTGKISLGGITRAADGTFAIASFGFGSDGGVIAIGADHRATMVPGLDPARRRLGITRGPDGTLYDGYFVMANHVHTGGVAKLDLASGETDLVTQGLGKVVGVAATSAGVFVSDQQANTIFAIDHGQLKPLAASLPGVDLLTALPNGSLVTGTKAGVVLKIAPDGTQSQIAAGLGEVRGTAYDSDGHRLFVVDKPKTGAPMLHVLPL